MSRTWLVRLAAIVFTLSVSSFQAPPTRGTLAWPPSLPSVPTSRATRVTSSLNTFSESTIWLRMFFNSRISPFTATVIFWLKSPRATAVATLAMSRTWLVRLAAMLFTLSVKSFHVPLTPGTWAWPPSLPSVPTSWATRLTSPAKRFNESTIWLRLALSCNSSPFTLTVIFWLKSPRATAVATLAMSRTWLVRFEAIMFTLSVSSFHTPPTLGTWAWPPSLPSVPTSWATRLTSPANTFKLSIVLLMVSAITLKSPDTGI